jgi:hypothetical protein
MSRHVIKNRDCLLAMIKQRVRFIYGLSAVQPTNFLHRGAAIARSRLRDKLPTQDMLEQLVTESYTA